MNFSLYEGRLVRLSAFDPEKDSDIEAGWSHDGEYCRAFGLASAWPRTAAATKKQREESAKKTGGGRADLAIRTRDDGRLIGRSQTYWFDSTHRTTCLHFAIGNPIDRGMGFGTDALNLVLSFGFNEMNLHRLAIYFADDVRLLSWLRKFGFCEDERRREAIVTPSGRVDHIQMSVLEHEWRRA